MTKTNSVSYRCINVIRYRPGFKIEIEIIRLLTT
jgi:hypothetical protein